MSSSSLKEIVEAIGADSAAIMVPNTAQKHLFCYESFNMPQAWIDIKNPFSETVPGGNVEVYKTGKPAITNHLQINLEGHYIESVMIVPIQSDGKTIAMLELIHSTNNKTFSKKDLKVAMTFAKKLDFRE